jgi:hypothetical protein
MLATLSWSLTRVPYGSDRRLPMFAQRHTSSAAQTSGAWDALRRSDRADDARSISVDEGSAVDMCSL